MTHLSLQLRSENPPFGSDFRLAPGSQVRVGASPKADISIPFSGIADISLIIGRSGNGLLYVSQPDGSGVRYIEPPAIVSVAPYHFVITESASTPVAAPSPPRRKRAANKQSTWQIIAGSIAALLFLGFVFAELRQSDSKPPAPAPPKDPVTLVKAAPEPAPLPVAPAPTPAPEPPQTVAEAPTPPVSQEGSKRLDLEEIGERAAAAVLTVEILDKSTGRFVSNGTAFAISPEGLAITNFHVIENFEAHQLRARTTEGEKISVTRIVAVNPKADLALLSLAKRPPGFLEIGDSREVKVGAPIAIFGAPDGLSGTLSEGIVSAKRRSSELGNDRLDPDVDMIQVTAPMSPGSSGSPVMDRSGKVVGVATMVYVGPALQNLNFAIAATSVIKLREDAARGLSSVSPSRVTSPSYPLPKKPLSADETEAAILEDVDMKEYERFMKKEDYKSAFNHATNLVGKYPGSPTAYVAQGAALLGVDLYDRAEVTLKQALRLDDESSATWYFYGVAQMAQKKYSEARRSFKRAVQLSPTYVQAWKELTVLALAQNDAPDAIASLQKVRELDRAMFDKWLTLYSNIDEPTPAVTALLEHFGVKSSADTSSENEFHALVIQLVMNYLASQEENDVAAELSHFSEVVNPYYEKGRRSKSEIIPHIQAFRTQWPQRRFEFDRLEQAEFLNGFNLEVTYVVRFTTSNGRDQRSGLMRQTLHFTEDGNRRWRISAIKTHTN